MKILVSFKELKDLNLWNIYLDSSLASKDILHEDLIGENDLFLLSEELAIKCGLLKELVC